MQTKQPFSDRTDRRHWQRTALQDGCLIFESEGALGEVFDISAGGIGLQSIYTLPANDRLPRHGLLCCHGSLLEDLSYDIVSIKVLPKNFDFSTVVRRRYGLQFTNLTDRQKNELDKIIRTCRMS